MPRSFYHPSIDPAASYYVSGDQSFGKDLNLASFCDSNLRNDSAERSQNRSTIYPGSQNNNDSMNSSFCDSIVHFYAETAAPANTARRTPHTPTCPEPFHLSTSNYKQSRESTIFEEPEEYYQFKASAIPKTH